MAFRTIAFYLLSAAVCSIAVAKGSSDGSIKGKITDPMGAAVPSAAVDLISATTSAQWHTQSDPNGAYQLVNLGAGTYLIEVRARGFSSYRVENIAVQPNQSVSLNLPLSVGTVQEEVSVTAASTPQTVDQIAKALTVVDSVAMQQRQDYSLLQAVRFTPGIRTEQQGGPGSFSEILIRGLRPEDTAVLVDGMRLRDPSGTQGDASSLLQDFLLPDVSRIEILRGSGSSLYGTNAIGGVVNVITDAGGGKAHGSLELQGGGLGLFQGSALVSGGWKQDRLQYSLGFMDLNVSNGVGDYNPARIGSLQTNVSYRLTPTMQLVARFLGSTSYSKVNTSPQAIADFPTGVVPAVPLSGAALAQFNAGVPLADINTGSATYVPSVNDPDSSRDGRFETGALSLLGQPTAKLGYTIDYQVVNSTRRYSNGPAGPGYQPEANTLTDYNGRIQTVDARANYDTGRYSLFTAGYEFENENYSGLSNTAGTSADNSALNVTQTSNTAFIQDQARFLDKRLYVAAAFRAQLFGLQQPTFVPAASAPYQNTRFGAPPAAYTGDGSIAYTVRSTGTKVRAHVGRGYRAPALFERFGAGYDPFFGYSVYGDPNLTPEQSIAFDAGVDESLLNNKLRLSGTYFYTHLQRVITFDSSGLLNPLTDPFGRFIGYINTNGGMARGVEFNADWALRTALTVSGSYTYTDGREETPLVPNVYRSFNTPQQHFTVFVVQRVGGRAFVDFALNASDNYLAQVYSSFASGAFQFPGFKRADLGFSYRLPLGETRSVRFFARAENLFDQTYYESGFLTPGITGRGGLQFEF